MHKSLYFKSTSGSDLGGFTIESASYHIRHATREDVDKIKALIRSSSVHSAGAHKGRRSTRGNPGFIRKVISKLLSPVFSSGVDWRNFVVVVSDSGDLIGCCRFKLHKDGVREVATISVDKAWRGRGIPLDGRDFMLAHFPRPWWGTCLNNLIPVYLRLGAVEVVDPGQMPPFLRRRQRLFNALLRLVRSKHYLAILVVGAPEKDVTDIAIQSDGRL